MHYCVFGKIKERRRTEKFNNNRKEMNTEKKKCFPGEKLEKKYNDQEYLILNVLMHCCVFGKIEKKEKEKKSSATIQKRD